MGRCFLRNRGAFLPDHGMHHPADCYGDTGAACGPLMAGLAALGIKQGYRRSPALVYGSSDGATAPRLWSAQLEEDSWARQPSRIHEESRTKEAAG